MPTNEIILKTKNKIAVMVFLLHRKGGQKNVQDEAHTHHLRAPYFRYAFLPYGLQKDYTAGRNGSELRANG